MERYCEPLYRADPGAMIDAMPSLLNTIQMIHSISRYYNTSERLTSLFVKVRHPVYTNGIQLCSLRVDLVLSPTNLPQWSMICYVSIRQSQ